MPSRHERDNRDGVPASGNPTMKWQTLSPLPLRRSSKKSPARRQQRRAGSSALIVYFTITLYVALEGVDSSSRREVGKLPARGNRGRLTFLSGGAVAIPQRAAAI
jgi:hypothetical protein